MSLARTISVWGVPLCGAIIGLVGLCALEAPASPMVDALRGRRPAWGTLAAGAMPLVALHEPGTESRRTVADQIARRGSTGFGARVARVLLARLLTIISIGGRLGP